MPHSNESSLSLNLNTKPIKSERAVEDGIRLSVMSRHTHPDGVAPDIEITENSFDEHWPELGPPPKLIGAYYKRGLPWKEFAEQYTHYLQANPEHTERLIGLLAIQKTVTLLCVEDSPDYCHRRLLAEHCTKTGNRINLNIQ